MYASWLAIILWATEMVVILFGLSSKRNMPMLFGTSYGSPSVCTAQYNLFKNGPNKKTMLYYKWTVRQWENLHVSTSRQQCRAQLVRYWKLWSVWFQKKKQCDDNENIQLIQIGFKNILPSLKWMQCICTS